MRKLQRGLGLLFISLLLLSCQQAGREKIVEIDFTNGNYSPGIDYFLGITLQPTPLITAVSRKVLRDSKLEIAGFPLELDWTLVRDNVGGDINYGDYYWFASIASTDLPAELEFPENEAVNIFFEVNGFKYQQALLIPAQPQINYPELNFAEDYCLAWSLVDSVDTQLLSLYYANNDFLISYFQQWSLEADLRDFIIPQSSFQAAALFEVQEYQIKLQSINYLHNSRFLFYVSNEANLDWPTNQEQRRDRNLIKSLEKTISQKQANN
ncbi:MAG: hypothetical protein R6U84_07290 [Candidatus Cloacimonadales bacterium]